MRSGTLLVIGAAFLVSRYVRRQRRRYDLEGKTVLITGGSRGLALVLSREFGKPYLQRFSFVAHDSR